MATARSKPMSVKDIVAKAQDFSFDPSIQLKHWLRTADVLLREVGNSRKSSNPNSCFRRLPFTIANIMTSKLTSCLCDMQPW